MVEVEGPPRKPNRHERRVQAAKNRKENRKLVKEIESRAKRQYDQMRKVHDLATKTGADDYAFG